MLSAAKQRFAICLAAGALIAWGCSKAPTSALAPQQSTTPPFVRVPVGGAQPFSTISSSTNSKDIDGSKGGSIDNGRFTLIVPPGAFTGIATVTILVPNPTVMQCQLTITPPEANHFAIPVQLVADCHDASQLNVSSLATLWYDELNQRWTLVNGSVISIPNSTITTPLMHFSYYGIFDGKAGW